MVDSPGEADGALCAGGEAALQAGGGAVHRPGLSTDTVVSIQDTPHMGCTLASCPGSQISHKSHTDAHTLNMPENCIYYDTHV